MLSPTKRDRLWLQCFDRSTVSAVRSTLLRFYTASKKLEECDLTNEMNDGNSFSLVTAATEFKLKGYPFWASDGIG